LPTQDDVTRNSEWGILRHEISKKKRHMPLRELMSSMPKALTKLTPCLLMSPLSIAQYLPPTPALRRGGVRRGLTDPRVGRRGRHRARQAGGDGGRPQAAAPHQLLRSCGVRWLDEEDVEGDLESILDECLGASLPTMNLAWHYRSRNESLIAFSNRYYYGGITGDLPLTGHRRPAVSFHHVKGTMKRWARINNPEAKALVADMVARSSRRAFANPS
jgi:hypothetical protein